MTDINLYNGSDHRLILHNSMTGGLDKHAYAFQVNSIEAGKKAEPYLWFNRYTGVKNGSVYSFATTFQLVELTYSIFISFIGSLTDSNYMITVSATNSNDQYQTTGPMNVPGSKSFTVSQSISGVKKFYTTELIRFRDEASDHVNISIIEV